jgi:hypothetical protein
VAGGENVLEQGTAGSGFAELPAELQYARAAPLERDQAQVRIAVAILWLSTPMARHD